MPRNRSEIDAEKAVKPRPDLIPPLAIEAAARAFAYGAAKHGRPGGRGTYRVAGTEQAQPQTHLASLLRHILAWWRGEAHDPESDLHHVDHIVAQAMVLADLVIDPPGGFVGGGSYPEILTRECGETAPDTDWPDPDVRIDSHGFRWECVGRSEGCP